MIQTEKTEKLPLVLPGIKTNTVLLEQTFASRQGIALSACFSRAERELMTIADDFHYNSAFEQSNDSMVIGAWREEAKPLSKHYYSAMKQSKNSQDFRRGKLFTQMQPKLKKIAEEPKLKKTLQHLTVNHAFIKYDTIFQLQNTFLTRGSQTLQGDRLSYIKGIHLKGKQRKASINLPICSEVSSNSFSLNKLQKTITSINKSQKKHDNRGANEVTSIIYPTEFIFPNVREEGRLQTKLNFYLKKYSLSS